MRGSDFDEYRRQIIVDTIIDLGGAATINEVIDSLWSKTDNKTKVSLGWRFFVHFNKIPAQLVKQKRIKFSGKYKQGNTKLEKLWSVNQ